MAEATGIAWTTSSWNPWIGCTEVSPGCDNCYARTLDRRHQWGGGTHWGAGKPRYRTQNWRGPLAWNKKAAATGQRWTVFPSLCDPFDNEVPDHWRADLFDLIGSTPALTWLLLTKRIGNASKMIAAALGTQEQWPQSFDPAKPLPNVWLGASVVNQEEADRDIPKLLATPAAKRFVSYEPALGPIDWKPFLWQRSTATCRHETRRALGLPAIDWIIVGGESTQGAPARHFRVEWARSTVAQCRRAGLAPFVKQMGAFVIDRNDAGFDGCDLGAWPLSPDGSDVEVEHDIHGFREEYQGADCRVRLGDRAGADPAEWPEDLRVQEFPA